MDSQVIFMKGKLDNFDTKLWTELWLYFFKLYFWLFMPLFLIGQ